MAEGEKKPLRRSDAWRTAKELIFAHRWRLAIGGVLMLIGQAAGLVLPASSKYIIDEVVINERSELLVPIALAAGASSLAQAIISFLLLQILGLPAERVIVEMRKKIQAHVGRLPVRYFDSMPTGKLVARIMNDAQGVDALVGSGLVNLSGSVVTGLLSLCVLLYLNWRLTVFTIIFMGGVSGAWFLFLRRMRPIFRERGEIYSEVMSRLTESLGGVRIVKAYTAEKREELVFTRGAHRLFRNIESSMTRMSVANGFSSLIFGSVGMVFIIIGGNAVLSGQITLGDLIMYVFFMGMIAAPFTGIIGLGSQITQTFAGLDRIHEILNLKTENEDDTLKAPISEIEGEVEFENVWFEYNSGVPVLKNISFKAQAGATTALVGPSGSGKSTLISLIMNFNRPLSGRVKVDGYDISTVKLRDYRSHLGIVLQDNFLFDGTIAENIAYSKPQATREEIRAVSRIARCDEFIEGFDDKYDTVVGERGVKLSGGQRQRIAIARALLADPKILILDEATSNLDSESESLIQEGLRALRQGRTTFVIAHRLSTIRNADQILVIQDGEIVERGVHETLLAEGGRYKELCDKQYKIERDKSANADVNGVPELPEAEIGREVPSPKAAAARAGVADMGRDQEDRPITQSRVDGLKLLLLKPYLVKYFPKVNRFLKTPVRKMVFASSIVAILLAVVAYTVANVFADRDDKVKVTIAKVERQAVLESNVMAEGEVRPIQFINLTAEVPGRVVEVFVKEGDKVKKGQPLLRVDPTQQASATTIQEAALRAAASETQNQTANLAAAENAAHTARAELNASESELERAKAERNNAEIELKRNAELLKSGITSRSTYDAAKMRFDSLVASHAAAAARVEQSRTQARAAEIRIRQAMASLKSSKAKVAQQQAVFNQAADQLRKTTQYANIDGVVVGPVVKVGTYAVADYQSTGLLLIADMSMINVEARVEESDIANISIGQKVKVKVDALRNMEIEGEVVEQAAAAQTRGGQSIAQTAAVGSRGAKGFRVVIRLTNMSDEARDLMRPGMSATAVITTARHENVITVPLQSLVERDPEEFSGKTDVVDQSRKQNPEDKKSVKGVFVIDNKKAVFTEVEIGIIGEDGIEIKSGLKEGQQIVSGPPRRLRTLRNYQQVRR
jgi:ATP-binding cassette, subfamily B, putative efflux pump